MQVGVPLLSSHILSTIIFLPLAGCAVLCLPVFGAAHDKTGRRSRIAALGFTLATFVISLLLLADFQSVTGVMQFNERHAWIPRFGINYSLGIDGISLFLLLLTTFLMPIVVLASHSVKRGIRGYLANMLALECAMLGTLAALDLFLFYVFWELMLAPMYFIIGIWGGKRRIYATLKFVLYTVVGSLLMLVAIFYVVFEHAQQTGTLTFSLYELLNTRLSYTEEFWLFLAFGLAFGIKVPIFPFHTWLPDAHVEAPTGGSVVLAGVLLKLGIYGYLRFAYPLFPRAAIELAPWIAGLAVIGIIYGALVAWAQTDIKKLIAYSSVSHLGYCVLGVAALNVLSSTGAIYQMLSHGITTGALFLLVGVLYDRRHTREIVEYGGLAAKVPVFAFLFLVFTLGSIALPLTTGFVGEFMILAGSFKSFPWLTGVALGGVVLGAVYMLTLYMHTMFGEIDEKRNGNLQDVNGLELAAFAPLFVLVFLMGVYPKPIVERMQPAVHSYVQLIEKRSHDLNRSEGRVKDVPLTDSMRASFGMLKTSAQTQEIQLDKEAAL